MDDTDMDMDGGGDDEYAVQCDDDGLPLLPMSGTPDQQLAAVRHLVVILGHADPRREVVANSDIPAQLVALLGRSVSTEINLEVCRALLQISVHGAGRGAIVAAQGLSILLPLIAPTPAAAAAANHSDLGLNSYAVAVVANLALEASKEIVQRGGLSGIVAVAESPNLTDKQNACRALFSMAIEFSDQLAAAGAVRPLKEALEVESPRVQKNAAGALANMSRNQAVLDHLLDAGVVPALLRLLRSDDTRVVRQVMRNLHSCAVHPKASRIIVESGVLPDIVELVKSDNDDFQKHGSGALCCVSHKHARAVAEAGGIPPLVQACKRHKQALRAVQALSASSDVKMGVVEAGGLQVLADSCSHSELRLAQVAVSAMANLAIGKTKALVLRHQPAWEAICTALRSDKPALQEQACRAFFGLSCHNKCAAQFVKDGIIGLLLEAMSSKQVATRKHAAGAIANLCNFRQSRDELLRHHVLLATADALWTGTDKLRLHASRALRLLGVADLVLPYHDSEGEQLASDLLAMVGNSEFSDCSFSVGPHSEQVFAHRCIIGYRCPELRRVLRCPPGAPSRAHSSEGDDEAKASASTAAQDSDIVMSADEDDSELFNIPVPDVQVQDFMYLLEYLYTGTIQAVAQRSAAPGMRPATAFAAKQGNARVNKSVMIDLAERFRLPGLAKMFKHKLGPAPSLASPIGPRTGAGGKAPASGRDAEVAATAAGAGAGADDASGSQEGVGPAPDATTDASLGAAPQMVAPGSGRRSSSVKAAAGTPTSKHVHTKRSAAGSTLEPGASIDGSSSMESGSRVLKLYGPLLRSGWMADAKIKARDGDVILVHKVVLCARCEYLHAMFDPDSNWRESRQAEVPVDVDGHVFRVLCQYMYTGRASMTVEQAPAVLAAAARYLLPGLQLMCELRLANALADDWSALDVALAPTAEVSAPTLRAYCIYLMLNALRCSSPTSPLSPQVVETTRTHMLHDELEHWATQWGFDKSAVAWINADRRACGIEQPAHTDAEGGSAAAARGRGSDHSDGSASALGGDSERASGGGASDGKAGDSGSAATGTTSS